jgi:hypothetical protein
MSSLVTSRHDDETYCWRNEDSTSDLYATDIPLSFADRLVTLGSIAGSGSMVGEDPDAISTNVDGHISPEPPYKVRLSP